MAERGLSVDHSTLWRWVQRYGPLLNQRLRRQLRRPNSSWRVDETYVRLGGKWVYLYRAVDSTGDTIDFMLSPNRDLLAAKHFLQLALSRTGTRPRVINVDRHAAYATAISELKQSGELGQRCLCRPCPYLNNIIEQDHRFIKKRIAAGLWFRSVGGALNTIVASAPPLSSALLSKEQRSKLTSRSVFPPEAPVACTDPCQNGARRQGWLRRAKHRRTLAVCAPFRTTRIRDGRLRREHFKVSRAEKGKGRSTSFRRRTGLKSGVTSSEVHHARQGRSISEHVLDAQLDLSRQA
jgi:transposase, IS6 family